MQKLLEGVAHYAAHVHPTKQALFDDLATGQAPEVLFLTCADSRIDPSLITQTDPGELFVCRNAGNLVPPASAGLGANGMTASIEYAVKALGVAHIVVCGHSGCGAVTAAMNPDVAQGLSEVQPWVEYVETGGRVGLNAAVDANVVGQLRHLRTYDFVAEAEAAGRLTLHGWSYDIGTGGVRIYDREQWVSAAELVDA